MRVLAVTTNASLVVALGSMMREWEVVTVQDVERAMAEGTGSSVALIDLGETDAGIHMADQLYLNGITIPCVVVGDKPVDDNRAWVLVRPFSLEELGTAVREAASGPARPETPPMQPEPPAPVEPSAPPVGNGSGAVAEWPEPEPGPEPRPARPEPSPRLGLKVVRPELEAAEELTSLHEQEPLREEVAEETSAEELAVDELAVEAPAWEPEPEPEREPEREPEPEPAPEPAGEAWRQPIPAKPSGTEATRPVWHEPLPREPAAGVEPAAGRWKLRRRTASSAPTEPAPEAPLVHRLKVAAAHARELEELIEQLPFLADLGAMAEGLIGEIDRQFVCVIASVSVLREDGYGVVAYRGLSRVEAGMVIPETQSLFSDVLKTREGVLIQPVDLAQGLVAGIGGARTEAMMVAPALVNDECVAMVVVGGDQFNEQDLDRLSDLAAEAAPGLSVAQLLERLRGPASY